MSRKRNEMRRTLESLGEQRTKMQTDLSKYEDMLLQHQGALTDATVRLQRYETTYSNLLFDQFKALTEAERTRLREQSALVETNITKTEAAILKIEANISSMTNYISKIEGELGALNARMSVLEAEISTPSLSLTNEAEDYFNVIRSLGALSSLQNSSNWRRAQEMPVYLCHCPPDAEPPFPLTLLHPAFARFVDRFNNTSTIEFSDVECKLVFQLCLLVAKDYDYETDKLEKFNTLVGQYLGLYIFPMKVVKYTTDGSGVSGDDLIYTSEGKKEGGNALFQGIHYFGLYLSTRTEEHRERNVCPCFFVELVGVHIRISGLAYLSKVVCQPLTTFMHCYTNTYDKTDMDCLCRAFWALKQGISELRQFYLSNHPQVDKRLPYPLQSRRVRFLERIGSKLLFVVEVEQSREKRIFKYCKRYGDEVHTIWAVKNLAPKLFKAEKIAGGWVAIEMEYLPPPAWKTVHQWARILDETEKSELQSAVQNALQRAHECRCEEKAVAHGDLRAPNILVKSVGGSYEIKFLDFDWAGTIESTTYPSFINTRLHWHEDVGLGKPLRQEHDSWWADKWTKVEAEDSMEV